MGPFFQDLLQTGIDRLREHEHFLTWLLKQIEEQQPDALLIAGDVFDNGNPSAAAQSVYYEFLADATQQCPQMQVIITAGNHDSASRLEAPRPLLSRHQVEIRGNVHRSWVMSDDGGNWQIEFDDLMIPINGKDDDKAIVLAVPYLRSDIVQNSSYSIGVNDFLRTLTAKARERHPGLPLVMMAHMYAKGAEIATKDASEKIVIGGQEEVNMEGWADHPDYLTCGHIHKRQHIWGTDWARYTGSILPMSFAEKDYTHGIDVVTLHEGIKPKVQHLVYQPQHKLVVLPEKDEELTPKKPKRTHTSQQTIESRSVGYRIQAYSDNNYKTAKSAAQQRARDIAMKFPQYRSYISYKAPAWRLRIGDFKTQREAQAALQRIKSVYPKFAREMVIVRDRINVWSND